MSLLKKLRLPFFLAGGLESDALLASEAAEASGAFAVLFSWGLPGFPVAFPLALGWELTGVPVFRLSSPTGCTTMPVAPGPLVGTPAGALATSTPEGGGLPRRTGPRRVARVSGALDMKPPSF